MNDVIRIGIIGMGGFAGAHHTAVAQLEAAGECRLVCTCDPAMDSFAARQQELRFPDRGVRLFTDYLQMLDACRDELDLVSIPTPIPLHAPMHRACVERGIPVYLEKPPTLNADELEAMLAVEARAAKATNVGFNYIVEADRQRVKTRILDGEFGAVRRVSFLGLSPRAHTYYHRTNWAGRLLLDGRLVLDSCIGNAMAHQAHDALFWCGTDALWSWGAVDRVSAELYRAHAIEGTDTVFVKAAIAQGPELCIAMSHGCANVAAMRERIECERAAIDYELNWSPDDAHWAGTLRWTDGREERWRTDGTATVEMNFQAHFDYLRGRRERPVTGLADSRPFVHLNDLMYLAAGRITTVPAAMIDVCPLPDGTGDCLHFDGLTEATEHFVATGDFPSAQGARWAAPGGSATAADLPRLFAAVEAMASGTGVAQ